MRQCSGEQCTFVYEGCARKSIGEHLLACTSRTLAQARNPPAAIARSNSARVTFAPGSQCGCRRLESCPARACWLSASPMTYNGTR